MRIQHNIMAMNAYRNYTNNTSALSKNLEKLSSGYRINRAGDDAAGLAISEKMRAQITGLSAAQKNVKDGISLVKTAEGATQEIHDMLNRMVYLAEQSANGTYQDEVDREAITDEFTQLKAEINRIADSSNFNGIKLLDGSLDVDGRVADTKTILSGLKASSNTLGTAVDATTGFGGANAKGGLMLTGVNLAATTTAIDKSDKSVRYHQDPKGEGKTSFTVDLDSANFSTAKAGDSIKGLVFGLDSATTPDGATGTPKNNCLFTGKTGDTKLTYDVTAGDKGITSEMVATAIQNAIDKNDGKVYLEPAAGGDRIEYTVTREGDKLKFTMTDDGYNAAVAANTADATKNYFQGNYNFAVNYKATPTGTTDAEKLEAAFMTAVGDAQHGATSNITEGSPSSGTIYAEALIRFAKAADAATGTNKIADVIKDGAGLQIGDEYYIFAKSDEVLNRDYADNVKVVDISDLNNLAKTDGTEADDLRKALDRLSVAAAGNEMFDVQVSKPNGDKYASLILTERSTYKGDANLTEKDFGLENQIKTFDSATSSTTVEKEAGTALTLQIGDTSDSFNQLSVSVSDMHTKALGIDSLNLGNQKGAQDAVQVIKDAINKVSSTRGRLGATQNRLEHTSNNLSVMKENIQDAESSIRDTDVAEEMMAYTKNNILVQSAQAMLAQANQIPQGVLQLLG